MRLKECYRRIKERCKRLKGLLIDFLIEVLFTAYIFALNFAVIGLILLLAAHAPVNMDGPYGVPYLMLGIVAPVLACAWLSFRALDI